jgi:head-tail adaptor
MNIGALRHRVTLAGEPMVNTPDGHGGYTAVPTVLATNVPAAIEPATARDVERRVGNTVAASVSHLVTIRYLPGVSNGTQVVFGTRRLYVRGVQNPEERNISLVLACEEIGTVTT